MRPWKIIWMTAALWAVFLCLPFAAGAAPVCGEARALTAGLERQFGERVIARMLDRRGALLRILVNPESGSWTMLATAPAGQSCIVGFGEGFEAGRMAQAEPPPAEG